MLHAHTRDYRRDRLKTKHSFDSFSESVSVLRDARNGTCTLPSVVAMGSGEAENKRFNSRQLHVLRLTDRTQTAQV